MSFIQKLGTTQTQKYNAKPLTEKSIKTVLDYLDSISIPKVKQQVLMTGLAGTKAFEHTWDISIYTGHVEDLRTKRKISFSEKKRLIKMIKSPDRENFEVVKTIVNNLMNESLTTIPTGKKLPLK